MKAAYIEKLGGFELIQYGDLERPQCGPSQVLVKVLVAAVDPIDIFIRSGQYRIPNMPMPYILGRDMCGVVVEVGKKVKHFSVNDRVWSNNQSIEGRQGTFAEYIAVDEKYLYPLPDGVDEHQMAAGMHSALTGYIGLIKRAKIKKNETVFIKGGAGNVGSLVLQVARRHQAQVIVSARTDEQIEWCYSLGASKVIRYTTEDVEKKILEFCPTGVDIYLDTTREPDFVKATSVLAHKGRILLIAGLKAHPVFPVGDFYVKDCSLYGYAISNATVDELKEAAEATNDWFDKGHLKAHIYKVLPLSQAKEAHRLMEQEKHIWGKILITTT